MDNPNDNKIVVKGDAGHGGEVRTSLSTPDGYRVKIDIRGRGDALIVIPSNFSGPRQQPRRRRGGGDNDDGNDEHGGGGSSIPSSSSSASKRIRVSSWCHGSVMGAICWGQETSAKCFDCCTVFWVAGLIRHVLPACGSAVAFGFDELFQTIVIYIYISTTQLVCCLTCHCKCCWFIIDLLSIAYFSISFLYFMLYCVLNPDEITAQLWVFNLTI